MLAFHPQYPLNLFENLSEMQECQSDSLSRTVIWGNNDAKDKENTQYIKEKLDGLLCALSE